MDFVPWVLLSQWLPVWERLTIPHIPAHEIGKFSIAEYTEWGGNSEKELPPSLLACARRADTLLKNPPCEPWVFRWDICAPEHLKAAMSRGLMTFEEFKTTRESKGDTISSIPELIRYYETRLWQYVDRAPPSPPFIQMLADDIRLYEIIDLDKKILGPDSNMKVYWRPWVSPLVYERYPVEFRVFVVNGEVVGVSNYYFRRELPEVDSDNTNYLHLARKAVDLTRRMIGHVPEHFTADWMAVTGEDLVLIECGPPHFACGFYWSVDPCCFPQRDTSGVLLKEKGERYPL